MPTVQITQDKRVLLDGVELTTCTRVAMMIEAGREPEVEFRIAADMVDIDGYTNGKATAVPVRQPRRKRRKEKKACIRRTYKN